MAYKNNADILTWKRLIDNLQNKTDVGVNAYNEAQEKVTEESDEDLINKVAMWIYHESDSPISEIEHLLKKSGAVGEYIDAVEGDQ